MAKKIKKLKLPLDKMSEKEKDYVAVVLEETNSRMAAFGEVLSGVAEKLEEVKRKGDATFEEVGRINERLTMMEIDIADIKKEIISIKRELEQLKSELSKKADTDKLELLETRIKKIEQHLKLPSV